MTKSESDNSLSIMTYNVQCIKRSIMPIANTDLRRESLVSFISDLVEDHDLEVLVLQELFIPDVYNQLKDALKTKLFYSTGIIGITNELGNWNTCLNRCKIPFHLLNGGVCIFSKYPIIEKHQLIFSNATGTCRLAKKGAALSIIDKNGVKFIIIGLHLQANHDEKHMIVRKKQMEEVSSWVFELYNKSIPSSLPYFLSDKIPIIVAGDFNTCILNENHFFDFIFKDKQQLLQLHDTFDGKKPDVTYSTFTNDFCKLQNRVDYNHVFDYIFTSGCLEPVVSQTVITKKLSEPVKLKNHMLPFLGKKENIFHISDHYPVLTVVRNKKDPLAAYAMDIAYKLNWRIDLTLFNVSGDMEGVKGDRWVRL